MPTLAMVSSKEADVKAWEKCYLSNGHNYKATEICAAEETKAFGGNKIEYYTAKVNVECVINQPSFLDNNNYPSFANLNQADEF